MSSHTCKWSPTAKKSLDLRELCWQNLDKEQIKISDALGRRNKSQFNIIPWKFHKKKIHNYIHKEINTYTIYTIKQIDRRIFLILEIFLLKCLDDAIHKRIKFLISYFSLHVSQVVHVSFIMRIICTWSCQQINLEITKCLEAV